MKTGDVVKYTRLPKNTLFGVTYPNIGESYTVREVRTEHVYGMVVNAIRLVEIQNNPIDTSLSGSIEPYFNSDYFEIDLMELRRRKLKELDI